MFLGCVFQRNPNVGLLWAGPASGKTSRGLGVVENCHFEENGMVRDIPGRVLRQWGLYLHNVRAVRVANNYFYDSFVVFDKFTNQCMLENNLFLWDRGSTPSPPPEDKHGLIPELGILCKRTPKSGMRCRLMTTRAHELRDFERGRRDIFDARKHRAVYRGA